MPHPVLSLRGLEDGDPGIFHVGTRYFTQAGEIVRFVGVSHEGSDYETMFDEDGRHRYTRRDYGRLTGTCHEYSNPGNTPPPFLTQQGS